MSKVILNIHLLIAVVLLGVSCSNSGSEGLNNPARTVDNSILRSQSNARSLLYKNDPTISYCESTGGLSNTYSGYRDLKPYALASISKVFLSAWALHRLGPDYRFQMVWKFKKISNDGAVDAYLQTNYDPIVNIEKILFALSELNKKGVFKIRNLIIDESTQIYLSVLSNPHLELSDVPVTTNQTIENLNKILNSSNWAGQTEVAKNNLLNINIPNTFSVQNISFSQRSAVNLDNYNQELRIPSVSLLKYLKNLNVYSNNYVTDSLFSFLGGVREFEKFQVSNLNISKTDLKILTGSGLSTEINGQRFDNLGNCISILKTLKFLDLTAQKNNLNLGHILLTAGTDDGTFESDLAFNKNVVLKTGRLFDVPTLNVAGVSAHRTGRTYFAMMAHNFDNTDESNVKVKRDELISNLINYKPQTSSFLTLKLDTLF